MNQFTVPIFIETNAISQEKLACGLLAITTKQVFISWSKSKIAVAEKLAGPEYKGYFSQQFQLFKQGLQLENKARLKEGKLFGSKSFLAANYFSYLKQYNAGPIQFGDPKPFAGDMDEKLFQQFFANAIGANPSKQKSSGSKIHRRFINTVSTVAIKQRADIEYLIPHEKVHGLVISPKVDLISVNGSILMVQALDMTKSVTTIGHHLYENEVIVRAMQGYGKQRKKAVEPMRLVVEPPVHGTEQEGLMKRTRKEKSDLFVIKTLEEIEAEMNAVADEKAAYQKFSEFVEG